MVPAIQYYQNMIKLNETLMAYITEKAQTCGFTDFHDKYTTSFPPPGPIPTAPDAYSVPGCDLYYAIYNAALYTNPCFNQYHLIEYCPYLHDELGLSLGGGPNNYFNRTDVKAVLHAPNATNFYVCNGGLKIFYNGDESLPSALGPLPSVIERTNNTIIEHGLLNFLLFANGTLITIQNMTWNGAQGFQTPPSATQNFFAPYHQSLDYIIDVVINEAVLPPPGPPQYDTAGAGMQGTWHTERGLTFVTVPLAGHMIPQYTPGAAYRMLEFLLGRIEDLSVRGDYTTQHGNFTGGMGVWR